MPSHQGCPSPAAPLPQARPVVEGPPHGSAAPPRGLADWVGRRRYGPLAGTGAPPGLHCPGVPGSWPGWGWGQSSYRGQGAECGRRRDGDRWGMWTHVDLLLCRFSTERTVAWNIFRLCTWIRPGGREMRLSLRQGVCCACRLVLGRWRVQRSSRVRGRSGPHLSAAGGPPPGHSAGTSGASSSVWG